jgi:competence protein ComEC
VAALSTAPPSRQDALRVDPALVVAACLVLGAASCVAPTAVLGTGALCLAIASRQLRFKGVAVGLLALSLGWGRASWVLARFDVERARASAYIGAQHRCALAGEVSSSPVWHDGALRFDAALHELDCEGQLAEEGYQVRLYGPARALARGDTFTAIADLAPVALFRNLDLPDPRPAAARQGAVLSGAVLALELTGRGRGLGAGIDRFRAHVRGRIEATFSPSAQGMARALVLGESDLGALDDEAFRKSGLSHLLAVSGTHLILAVLALLRALEAGLRRWEWLAARADVRRPAALVGLVLAPLYADFAGGSGSAWRAAYMLITVLGIRALGRHALTSRVLGASLVLGWLGDGLVVFDPSFLLSLAATVGLLCIGGRVAEGLSASPVALTECRSPDILRLARGISRAALTTLAATVPCAPILLTLSPGLSLASVAANLLAAPLGEAVALPLCLLHALLGPLPALERGTALVASGALTLIRELAHASSAVDWLYFELPPPHRWHLATLVLGAGGHVALAGQPWLGRQARATGCLRWATRAWACACVLTLVFVEAATVRRHSASHGRELGRLKISALDVGQGDATLIDLPDGRLMLIDGGGSFGGSADPGQRVILASLRARRRRHLDIVVLSHPHPDHYGGLLAVAEGVSIGELWYGGQRPPARPALVPATPDSPLAGEPLEPYARLLWLLERRGVPLRTAQELCASPAPSVGYEIEVLAPCPDVDPAQSANDNSLVLRLRIGHHAALLMGDAERWAEQRLLERRADALSADFLKVGHHGSRSSSSPELIARVAPRVATLSCGIRNRFGHPHPETLRTLAAAGALSLRLDQTGGVSWETDGTHQAMALFVGFGADAPADARGWLAGSAERWWRDVDGASH